MAELTQRPKIELQVTFNVTEEEARALDALVGYGDDAFVKAFYELLGKAYMRDHEKGLRLFFKSCRDWLPGILERTNDARRVFDGSKIAINRPVT